MYGDCQHLQADNRCGNYEDRPHICREYSTDACEYDDPGLHEGCSKRRATLGIRQAIFPPQRKPRKRAERRGGYQPADLGVKWSHDPQIAQAEA